MPGCFDSQAFFSTQTVMTRTDYSQLLRPFVASLSTEEREFVAAYNLHAHGWQERVPAQELPRAADLQQRAVAYLNSLLHATDSESYVVPRSVIRKSRYPY